MRALGYKPDLADNRDVRFSARPSAAGALPTEWSLEQYVELLNQLSSNSCVGHGIAGALYVGMRADGEAKPFMPAPLAFYTWGRLETDPELVDEGTYIRSGFKGAQRFGIPAMPDWPTDMALVNQQTPHRVFRAAYDRKGLRGYQRIAMGDIDGMRRAIFGGSCPVFGITVRQSFLDHTGSGMIEYDKGNLAGGHCLYLCGYRPGAFRLVNSWGKSWGDDGFAWISEERMGIATDVWNADYDPSRGGVA